MTNLDRRAPRTQRIGEWLNGTAAAVIACLVALSGCAAILAASFAGAAT